MAHLTSKELICFLDLLPASDIQEYPQHYAADNTGIASLATCRYLVDFLIDHDTKIDLVGTVNASRCVKTSSNPVPVSWVDFAGQFVECHRLTGRNGPKVEGARIHGEAVGVYIPGPRCNSAGFQCEEDLLCGPSLQ